MGPGLYSEIGKKARDLLYKDYHTDQKFSFTTYTDNGVAITGTSTRKDEVMFGEAHFHLKKENLTYDAKVVSDKVFSTITVDDLGAPGLKTIFSWVIPDQNSGKVEVQYLHDYAGVNASTGLNAHPLVNLSGVLGTKTAAVGADVSFDTGTGSFPKCNVGLSVTDADLVASLTLNNKGDSLNGSYYHLISPLSNTAIGAELTHSFSTNENTLTFGTQHALDPLTTVKTRFNNYGKASGLIQHQFRPKSFVTLSAEVDTKAIEKSSKVGISLALKS